MTCRHQPNDPNCSSSPDGRARAEEEYRRSQEQSKQEAEHRRQEEVYARTPDADKYEITDVARVGDHLVLKVKYPNCSACAYEGNKVLVFENVSEVQVLKWRKIDPHFRDPKKIVTAKEAPAPAARFPASQQGWADALAYAEFKRSLKWAK